MSNNLEALKATLSNRIWTTKKSRMNAEARLLKTNDFLQFIIVYYSAWVIGISLVAIFIPRDWLNFSSIVSSIMLSFASVYLPSQKYTDRANNLKENYTKLSKLEFELELLEDEGLTSESIKNISDSYQDIISQAENHKEIDFYRTQEDNKDNKAITKSKRLNTVLFLILRTITIIMPIITLVLAAMNMD